jgi:hypothetical protein
MIFNTIVTLRVTHVKQELHTVLGPILFTIYITDLPDVVQNIVKLFADDTKLILLETYLYP